jgi:hypothetical protein
MSETYAPPPPPTSAAPGATSGVLPRALLALWALLTLMALAFVAGVGTNAPYADEWDFVPGLLNGEPLGPWLWERHNEHRLPLPRLVWYALFQVTHDFRTGMFVQVAILSALALALMRFAALLRGAPHVADAFFPISLLHIGHWENWVMGYQLCFALFAALGAGLIAVALRIAPANRFRFGAVAAALLLLLALTHGAGIAVVPPVALWLAWLARAEWRAGAKGRALVLLGGAALPVAYLAVCLATYAHPPLHPPRSTDPGAVARVTAEVLAMPFGIGLCELWWLVALAVLVLGGATVALLWQARNEPDARASVFGLLALAAGFFGLALAIGIGRGAWGAGGGVWSRYSILVWPLLAAAFLAWARAGRKWVPLLLCAGAALAFPGNVGTGIVNGARVQTEYFAIGADLAAGLTPEQLTDARDPRRPFPVGAQQGREAAAVRAIPLLKAARIGIFAGR